MGIKGIYRELGPGKRISLAKLATEQLETSGRPLRLAIDIAIWQFQTQAARGGTNPAIRTLFYRLVRLLNLAIQPIFVFDGPHKPAFKRNKRSGRGDGVATAMAKRLIRLFGFPVHDAPGEAEAECALLQQQGIVDAVLSEDVDTIMFGCTRTLRNWTAEGVRGSKTPTHVSMYDVNDLLSAGTGLDREGMVLVALMSGGDYIPEGVPGCGVKLACEAAKAGFGKSLCRLKIDEVAQFEKWKVTLKHELRTNESGYFRVRHKALSIPDEFPCRQVLRHYTHPVVSNSTAIETLKTNVDWSRAIDIQGLRYFVEETFDWVHKVGAVKLTRVLSPGLLVHKLLERHMSEQPAGSIEEMGQEEAALVKRISGRRSHHSTDGTPELRVAHIPADIVGLDLSQELDETVSFGRQGLALNSDEEFDAAVPGDVETADDRSKARNIFDPTVSESIWLPESLLKLSVPLAVEDWEEKQRSKAARASVKAGKTKASQASLQEAGNLDKWVQITNSATTEVSRTKDTRLDSSRAPPTMKLRVSSQPKLTPASSQQSSPAKSSVNRSKQSRSNGKATAAAPTGHKNPWAYAGSQHMPRITKPQYSPEPIVLSSSPLHASPAPACTSLTSASQHIIDLSGLEETCSSKSHGPSAQPAASSVGVTGDRQPARTNPPMLPNTPRRGKRSMKQTRIDSFITSPPRPQSGPETNRWPEIDQGKKSVDTGLSVCQPKHSTLVEVEQIIPSQARASQGLATWTDDDVFGVPATKAAGCRSDKKMVPRTSAFGFFKRIENNGDEEIGDMASGPSKCSTTTAWRESGVSIIDLTGDNL